MKATEILDILNELYKEVPCDFSEDTSYRWFECRRKEFETAIGQHIEVGQGVSKFVIVPLKENYVIKIPFWGREEEVYRDCEDEDEDTECESEYEYEFCNFTEAGNYDDVDACDHLWNYCNAEVSIYEEAERNDCGDYLAAEQLLGFIGDHPVYKQDRAITYDEVEYEEDFEKKHENSKETVDKFLSSHGLDRYIFPSAWIVDFITHYGEEALVRFYKFCDDYHLSSDMHTGNFGYSFLGKHPILIDYSNFEG